MTMNVSGKAGNTSSPLRMCLACVFALQAGTGIGCSRTETLQGCEKVACVRVSNQSAWDLDQVLLFHFDGGPTCLGPVTNRSEGPYQEVPFPLISAVRVDAYGDGRTFCVKPADYVGAKRLGVGRYTLVLTIDEGDLGARLSHD